MTFDGTPYTLYLGNKDTNCTTENTEGCLYYHFHKPGPLAVRAAARVLPKAVRFIAMFRDPLEMVISQYPDPLLYAGVLLNHPWKTCFAKSLSVWLDVYPKERFLFLDSDEYFKDAQSTLDRIFEFLGVEPKKYSSLELDTFGRRRATTRTHSIPPQLRRAFHTIPYNRQCKIHLERMTDIKFKWKMSAEPVYRKAGDVMQVLLHKLSARSKKQHNLEEAAELARKNKTFVYESYKKREERIQAEVRERRGQRNPGDNCTQVGGDADSKPELKGCCDGLAECKVERPKNNTAYCPPDHPDHNQKCWSMMRQCRETCLPEEFDELLAAEGEDEADIDPDLDPATDPDSLQNRCDGRVACVDAKSIEELRQCC